MLTGSGPLLPSFYYSTAPPHSSPKATAFDSFIHFFHSSKYCAYFPISWFINLTQYLLTSVK